MNNQSELLSLENLNYFTLVVLTVVFLSLIPCSYPYSIFALKSCVPCMVEQLVFPQAIICTKSRTIAASWLFVFWFVNRYCSYTFNTISNSPFILRCQSSFSPVVFSMMNCLQINVFSRSILLLIVNSTCISFYFTMIACPYVRAHAYSYRTSRICGSSFLFTRSH